jgi:hypothetical protein
MHLNEKIELKKAIVSMFVSDKNTLLTVDEGGNFREYSLEDYKMINSLKTKIRNTTWNRRISFSRNAKFLIYGMPSSSNIKVFSLETKEVLYEIEDGFHQNEILSTVTGAENKYFISTSRDGRAFLWNLKSGTSVFTFPKHFKPINIATFNSNNTLVATGSEDGQIQIYDITKMKQLKLIRYEEPIRSLEFLSDKYLISLDKSNKVILWRHLDGKQIKIMLEYNAVITKMVLSKDENFLFLSTIKGSVILYNLLEHKVVNMSYIFVSAPITNILTSLESGDVILSDAKGGIYFYSGEQDQVLLKKYIQARKYQEAYNLILKNDLLKFTQEAEILEMIWKKVLAKSKELLETGMKDTIKVELMLEPFAVVPEKKEIIDNILNDFKQFKLLLKFIDKESYYLAYDLVEKHQNLARTKAFKKLEAIWQEYFRRAKVKLFERNGEKEAKEILNKFAGVSEKAFAIRSLFQQKGVYIQFQNLLKRKDYNGVIKLVKEHRFLETTSEYQNVLKKLDDIYIQMKIAVKKSKLEFAYEKAKILKNINYYKEEVEATLKEIEVRNEFRSVLQSQDLNLIFSMVEEYPYLQEFQTVQKLNKKWKKTVFKAEELASKGEIDEVKEVLQEFYDVQVKFRKMANIFKLAYLIDLQNTVSNHGDDLTFMMPILKRGIKNYLLSFGKDQEIKDLVELIRSKGGEKIDLFQYEVGNIEEWTPEKVKTSILD